MSSKRLSSGQLAEQHAAHWLEKQKCTILHRNYASKQGEIDLIVEHLGVLVFVEVRLRHNLFFGTAAASVNKRKQEKIRNTAKQFLLQFKRYDNYSCRFDVIAYDGDNPPLWIQNAFT